MHVLTKIFIVLVSLLAVLLVPLVVVYAHNENSFQQRYQDAEAAAAAARSTLETAKARYGASEALKDAQIQQLEAGNVDLRKQIDQQEAENRGLQLRLAEAEGMQATINAKLSTLASAVDAGQELSRSLIEELRNLRQEALASERRSVELDEALRDTRAQLAVAVEARRATEEELQRLKEEHAGAMSTISEYVARVGPLEGRGVNTGAIGRTPTVALEAKVLSVRRNADQVLAEIDAGSRDGVEKGWVLTIGAGGEFIARLRIISVDINRATGIVELEDPARGRVEKGQRVLARPGR